MTLTPFEIIFSLIIFVFAVFPVGFLYYLKSYPEKIKEYAVRPTRQKIVHKLLLWFLGFSVFSVYLLAFSIGFSVVTTDIAVAYGFGFSTGLMCSIWIMYALAKLLPTDSRSSFLTSIIVFSIVFALCFIGPSVMLSEPLLNGSTIHVLSLIILTITALWMNSHPSKEAAVPHVDEIPESNSATSKIDLAKLVDSVPDISTASTQVSEDVPAVAEAADKSVSHDETVPTIIVSEPQAQISTPQKKHPNLPHWVITIILIVTCILCVLIGYLAGGGYLSEDLVPNSPYIQKLKKAESDASSKGYKKGYHDGRDDGYIAGKEYGYSEGYSDGYDEGASDELALLLDDYLG